MKIYVCPCIGKEKSMEAMPSVIAALIEHGITPVLSESVRADYSDERAEYSASGSFCHMM